MFILYFNLIISQQVILHFADGKKLEYESIEQTLLQNFHKVQRSECLSLLPKQSFDFKHWLQDSTRNDEHMEVKSESFNENFSNDEENSMESNTDEGKIVINLNMSHYLYKKLECLHENQNNYVSSNEAFQLINSYAFSTFDNEISIIHLIFNSIFTLKIITFDLIFYEFCKSLQYHEKAFQYKDQLIAIIDTFNSEKLNKFRQQLKTQLHENTKKDEITRLYGEFEHALSKLSILFRQHFTTIFYKNNLKTDIACKEKNVDTHNFLTINNHDFDDLTFFSLFNEPCLVLYDLNDEYEEYFLLFVNSIYTINFFIDITELIIKIADCDHQTALRKIKLLDKILYQIVAYIPETKLIMNQRPIRFSMNFSQQLLIFYPYENEIISPLEKFHHLCMGLRNFCAKYHSKFILNQIIDTYQKRFFNYEVHETEKIFVSLSDNSSKCALNSVLLTSDETNILFNIQKFFPVKNRMQTRNFHQKRKLEHQQWINGYCETKKFICHDNIKFYAIVTKKFINFEIYEPSSTSNVTEREFSIDGENRNINLDFCPIEIFAIRNSKFKILLFGFMFVVSLSEMYSSINYNLQKKSIMITRCSVHFIHAMPFDKFSLELNFCDIYGKYFTEKNVLRNDCGSKNSIHFKFCNFYENFRLLGDYYKITFNQCNNTCTIKASFVEITANSISKIEKVENFMFLSFSINQKNDFYYNTISKQISSKSLSMGNAIFTI